MVMSVQQLRHCRANTRLCGQFSGSIRTYMFGEYRAVGSVHSGMVSTQLFGEYTVVW